MLGPVVQRIVSLTSLLVVKMFPILISTISNSQVFLLKKNVSSFGLNNSLLNIMSTTQTYKNDIEDQITS